MAKFSALCKECRSVARAIGEQFGSWARKIVRRMAAFLNDRRRKFLWQAGTLLLLLGLMGFAIYQCTGHVTMGLSTLRTQEITEYSYTRMELYVFRDETPVTMSGDLCAYDVRNGQRIGVGDTVARSYDWPSGSGEDIAALQTWLDLYADRWALATAAGQGSNQSEAKQLATVMDEAYMDMLATSDQGDLAGTFGYADALLDSMDQYRALTGSGNGAFLSAERLTAERAERLSGLTTADTFVAEDSGYFYYRTDGYESVFDYNAAMTMTPAEFLALAEADPIPAEEGTVGKMVWRTGWYAAAYVSPEEAAAFEERIGRSYDMTCTDHAGTVLTMTLKRVEKTEDGALVVFHSVSMPDGFDFDRCIGVETVSDTVSGYRVPAEAVVTLTTPDGESRRGVYVLVGNVVEFRKLRVLEEYEGYLIAETYETVQSDLEKMQEEAPEDFAAEEADGWLYLDLNDNIITRGTGLYEGKTIG